MCMQFSQWNLLGYSYLKYQTADRIMELIIDTQGVILKLMIMSKGMYFNSGSEQCMLVMHRLYQRATLLRQFILGYFTVLQDQNMETVSSSEIWSPVTKQHHLIIKKTTVWIFTTVGTADHVHKFLVKIMQGAISEANIWMEEQ